MNKIKIIVALTISLLIIAFFAGLVLPSFSNIPLSHVALKLDINQDRNSSLSVSSLSTEDVYPLDYRVNLPSDYYIIRMLDKNKSLLFSGKVLNKAVFFADYLTNGKMTGKQIIEPLDKLELYLPYYKQAEKVLLLDEQGKTKLEINLKDYKLEIPKVSQNLCGNGICDSNENILSCYRDCKIYWQILLNRFKIFRR